MNTIRAFLRRLLALLTPPAHGPIPATSLNIPMPAGTKPPPALRQPPPMREVTKGWFTMREEPKTVEQLRQADG